MFIVFENNREDVIKTWSDE